MADHLAKARGITTTEAYHLASHVGDLRVGAVWSLWHSEHLIPVPFCLHLSKQYFRDS
jgi:hypothetical protein